MEPGSIALAGSIGKPGTVVVSEQSSDSDNCSTADTRRLIAVPRIVAVVARRLSQTEQIVSPCQSCSGASRLWLPGHRYTSGTGRLACSTLSHLLGGSSAGDDRGDPWAQCDAGAIARPATSRKSFCSKMFLANILVSIFISDIYVIAYFYSQIASLRLRHQRRQKSLQLS